MVEAVAIVRLIHTLIVIAAGSIPFVTERVDFLAGHLALMIGMMCHWLMNANNCVLSMLEASIRGVAPTNTFIFSIVAPIYELPFTMRQQRITIWSVSVLLTIACMAKLFRCTQKLLWPSHGYFTG